MRFTVAFGLRRLLLASEAARSARRAVGPGWPFVASEAYLSACFLTLAVPYAGRSAGLGVEAISRRRGWLTLRPPGRRLHFLGSVLSG